MTPAEEREQIIQRLIAKGRTRDQAEAAMEIARSAFARRGWIDGEPLNEDELKDAVDRLVGGDGDGGI